MRSRAVENLGPGGIHYKSGAVVNLAKVLRSESKERKVDAEGSVRESEGRSGREGGGPRKCSVVN